jgi:hypothetical protein
MKRVGKPPIHLKEREDFRIFCPETRLSVSGETTATRTSFSESTENPNSVISHEISSVFSLLQALLNKSGS